MDLLMIYRLQIACGIVTLFIAIPFFVIKQEQDFIHRLFRFLIVFQIISLTFDIITVYTVNYTETVSELVNKLCHMVFIPSLCIFIYLLFIYTRYLATEDKSSTKIVAFGIPIAVSTIVLILAPLERVETAQGNHSGGWGINAVYFVVGIYLVMTFYTVLRYRKNISSEKRRLLWIALLTELFVSVFHLFVPAILITCLGTTIVTLAIYLTIENPERILKEMYRKAYLKIEEQNRDILIAKREAENANKSKSNFLAGISHEIRTPMNAIMGITELQLQNERLPDEFREPLAKIHNSGSTLLGIINDILDMSKIETGKMEINPVEYDVPSLINDTVQLNIVRLGSKPIQFILEADENLPARLIGDELRLKQILSNLISNAIKYTDKGSVKLSVRFEQNGDDFKLIFEVTDTGQGMKPEDKEKLFTEYLRFNAGANRSTEGTGLGLSITKNLVEMMGGTISVESEYGKGSVFTATVMQKTTDSSSPIGASVAQRLRSFAYVDSKTKERRKTIRNPMPYGSVLIVDDVDSNLYVAEGILSPYKLKIETATSGFEAIGIVKSGKVYDIIFMDHMMPKMDGVETTLKLRELGYEGAIVALTANALVGNEKMFKAYGFNDFISKPIDIRRLNSVLNRYIRDKYPEEAKKYGPEAVKPPETEETGKTDAKLKRIFVNEAEKAIVTLRESLESGDVKLLTTAAHGMKSALANVGQQEGSEAALALEEAGRRGDTEYVTGKTGEFIGLLEDIIEKLRPETENSANENAEVIAEDLKLLAEQLEAVRTACQEYDSKTAYAALDRLAQASWKPGTEAALEEIRNALFLDSDFEKAAQMAEGLLKQ